MAHACIALLLLMRVAAVAPEFAQGVQAQQTGDDRRAVTLFTVSLQADSAHAESRFRRAQSYYRLAQAPGAARESMLDSALSDVNRALEQDTANGSAHNLRGLLLLAQGRDVEAAVQSFTSAIRANPRYAQALFNRAEAFGRLGHNDRALGDLSVTVGLKPYDHVAFGARAALYAEMGRCSLAVLDFETVLTIVGGPYSPRDERIRAETLRQRGNCLLQLGRYDEALADHRAALPGLDKEAYRVLAHAWADRAAALQRDGAHATVVALYTNAIAFNRGMNLAYAGRARSLYALQRYGEALADCDTVLSYNPDSYLDLALRAETLARLDRREEAQADRSRAAQLAARVGVTPDAIAQAIDAITAKEAR